MGKFDKQLKYSIRKVSVGAASVVIGAFYLAMGAGVVHAETNTTDGGASHSSPSPESETSRPNGLTSSSYGAEPAQNPGVFGKSKESTTPKEKENKETLNAAQPTEASTSANTRGRRVRREVGDAPTGETSGNSTETETPAGSSTGNDEVLDSAVTERKGATVQPNQPGVTTPSGGQEGADDPNAHLKFDELKENATVEELWNIIKNLPDDFQNNERSYLRNMNTLGDALNLKPGEIRELHEFGGWHAIDKDGTQGKFVIGRKNEQGYFTGWHKVGETSAGVPIIEQGGMLGADALDNIYVHEQALDRRFNYMLMLVKGRTRANRNETVADNSTYDPRTPNERTNLNNTEFNKLPFLEKDKYNKYSPGVVGYNGIEKNFTAFSTKYGSRVRVEFVTGYISDINGSKGSYRVVIKTQNSQGQENTVYDETIHRVAEIVQNEELYKKGLDVEQANSSILKFFKDEFNSRFVKIRNEKVKANPLLGRTREKDYTPAQREVYNQIVEEATEEAKKQGDIVMNVDRDFLSISKSGKAGSEWKKVFSKKTSIALANDLNTMLKKVITPNPGDSTIPTWVNSSTAPAKADDRTYKLLTALIPGVKKITYHINDDQLEVETDKYTYIAARNGSKEVGIQGSDIVATDSAASYGFTPDKFAIINSNTTVNNNYRGWARANDEGFQNFSKLIGADHGINRTNVLTDEELSDKIIEKLGPGNKKLGRAGYFSTADIPLEKDVVSYTIQVFSADNERVGVNPQSHRIQYNMPILADFSVLQDTAEVSKEVARRIIHKSNIPEEKKNKIIEKINKSKKTSEIRSAMSGNVKVRYVDKATGNVITNIKNENTFGEKDSENRYTAAKDVLINSTYDVRDRAYSRLSTTDNKYYSLVADNGGLATDSAEMTGTIDIGDKVVTFVYEETVKPPTPATGKGVVHFKKQVSETATESLTGYDDITLTGNVGEQFSSNDVDTKITELKRRGYDIVMNEFDTNDKTIDSTADVDGEEPSQVYNVIVKERTVTDTETKTVTRTIKYVKIDDSTGNEVEVENAQPTNTKTVEFTRNLTINLVTGLTTNGTWSEKQTLEEVKTPVLTGYVANKATVESSEVTADSTDIVEKVIYRKIGSWIPKVPGEETPTPIPYPNNPDDATKPKYPDYPNTPENPSETPTPEPENPGTGTPEKPKTPVIPYVEGYVPKIPTDPTTPVGEDNPLKPLVPIDPNDPKKGYKVPELPNDPKKDTVIEYKPNPQKILIKVVNVTTGEEVELPNEKLEFNGVSDQVVTSEDKGKVDKKIDSLQKRGYIVSTKNPITETTKYDTKDDSNQKEPTQTYKIIVNEPVTKDTEVRKVTRTIKYVKIDVQDGNEVRTELNTEKIKTKVDKVEFSRDTTTSLATGLTKIGAWDQETKELPKVNTPVLVGYIANVASVENKSVSPDTESYEVTVEYRKIGSWVPNLPEGVTPPAGTNFDPKPYPNHPTDPTKPTDPEYPQPGTPIDPATPVIPHVPGYTPKTPDGNPLEPVNPNHPENGYKVPPVPTTPGTNTSITYEGNPQKVLVKVVKVDGTTETPLTADYVNINGKTGDQIPTESVTAKIAELEKLGYVIDNKQDVLTAIGKNPFDQDKDTDGEDPTQTFTLKVHEKVVEVTEPPTPNTPVDPNIPDGPKWPETGLAKSDLEKEVTRTITYVKKETADGPEEPSGKEPVTQPAHFKRSATYNLVTKVVTPGNWGSTDNTLTAVPTEKLEGYIADRASVEAVTVPDTSGNITEKVVYTKLGSWVPNLPKGVTPPEGTDMTPKPYPNHPTDPTKPGDPTPGLIPYVPGYTPNVGGTPLVPKNPTDLTEGYTPPTPTDPKTNIEINYTPDPQKAVVKVYTIRDGVKIELPNEKVSIDSGIPDAAIPSTKLDEKIKDLEKRGYIVDNKTPLKGETFDKVKDSETGDPSQVYELILRERTSVETETKSVTRTIKYYKIDETNGSKVEVDNGKLTNTKTAEFTREVTTNLATGLTTIGAWSDKQTLDEVKTPVLTGYIADKVKVPSSEVTADTESFEEEVVYKKIGSWVPKVPGVENPTPIPYPNDPNDPTKPKYPDYLTTPENPGETPNPQPDTPGGGTPGGETPGTPEKPKTPPVIPYVPGYTPKIGETPLQPVDPEHPENGYKVPPIPETPGEDTPIEYEADTQKAIVKYVVEGTTTVLHKEELTGDSGTTINYTTANKLAELKVLGYELVTDGFTTATDKNFDKDKTVDQTFEVTVKPKVVDVPPFEPTNPKGDDNPKPEPGQPIDPKNPNGPKWTKELIDKLATTKHVTRTITYVEDGTDKEVANKATDKVTFTRSLKVNVVTGDVVDPNVAWTSNDTTFDEVTSPVVKGYILKANQDAQNGLVSTDGTRVVASENLTEASENQNVKVAYIKLGSWIPNEPGKDKPTPIPYPNNPTDPTKPGEPTDPNVPVIPYVPGYTPKIGETPLVPKVPTDPTQGYIPPVPTEPGQDTPIEYVKVPNTPSPEEPVKPTPESNHITIWVDENGKPLKPEKPGTHEPGNIPGYRLITTVTKDGVTIHKFEKITPVDPNNPVPQKPTTPIPTPQDPTIPTPESQIPTPNAPEANTPTSETNRREELPNTGTEANATLASAGIMTLLAGLGLGFFKKKEEDEK